jgi:cytochrome c peroxidase
MLVAANPHLDKKIRVVDFLSGHERGDLLEFVKSLTGEMPANVGLSRRETASRQ